MITNKSQTSGVESFNLFIFERAKEAHSTKLNENFFHYDIVADAFNCGLEKGKQMKKEEAESIVINRLIDRFIERANQVYLSAKKLTENLAKENFHAKKIYINIFHRNPKVIVVVDENYLLDDDFVFFVYPKLNEMKNSFFKLFENTLDISLIGDENISEELLVADGFSYSEDIA